MDGSPLAVSIVMGPNGEPVRNERRDEEGILYADLDLNACVEPKQMHDISGSYNRFDIFKLVVNRSANQPITFKFEGTKAAEAEGIAVDERPTPASLRNDE